MTKIRINLFSSKNRRHFTSHINLCPMRRFEYKIIFKLLSHSCNLLQVLIPCLTMRNMTIRVLIITHSENRILKIIKLLICHVFSDKNDAHCNFLLSSAIFLCLSYKYKVLLKSLSKRPCMRQTDVRHKLN